MKNALKKMTYKYDHLSWSYYESIMIKYVQKLSYSVAIAFEKYY